jgi:hypothetical protein
MTLHESTFEYLKPTKSDYETKPSPRQICDALIVLQNAGVDLNSVREAPPAQPRPRSFVEYGGMSYEAASREAARLIEQEGWFNSFDRLAKLRAIMLQEMQRYPLGRTHEAYIKGQQKC